MTTDAASDGAVAIQVRGLTKAFAANQVLRSVDLDVKEGEFLTLFGPNGAGKTTMVRILAGLSRPTGGKVLVRGYDLRDELSEVRRLIGVLTHQTFLYDELTAEENLRFFGRMYDVPNLTERTDYLLGLVGLEHARRQRVRTFSRGMQQRLAIARTIIHEPSVLLLDEPDTGLDVQAAEMLSDLLRGPEAHKRTVVMTTHNFRRGFDMCDRAVIMVKGRIVFEGVKECMDVVSLEDAYRRHARIRV